METINEQKEFDCLKMKQEIQQQLKHKTKMNQTMKVLVDIRDNEMTFAMKVLQSLTFVKKAKPMTNAAADLWDDLTNAAQDVRLHKQGKLNLKTAQELLHEL